MAKSRWRVGGFELISLLDKEAWLLSVKDPSDEMLARLGRLQEEIREVQARVNSEDV